MFNCNLLLLFVSHISGGQPVLQHGHVQQSAEQIQAGKLYLCSSFLQCSCDLKTVFLSNFLLLKIRATPGKTFNFDYFRLSP